MLTYIHTLFHFLSRSQLKWSYPFHKLVWRSLPSCTHCNNWRNILSHICCICRRTWCLHQGHIIQARIGPLWKGTKALNRFIFPSLSGYAGKSGSDKLNPLRILTKTNSNKWICSLTPTPSIWLCLPFPAVLLTLVFAIDLFFVGRLSQLIYKLI